ncbi:SlyX family protein [Roseovarius nubinhibens]|uniref:SlyX protein, putative n=1 Tax=Roseovarius nubinhibens (strain ATCC BAA-591 / DSM 15170 / ISM) TaxID=89187 RepID=A3SMZ8_ROSNI|nr:SlyX family protein [Roseovarius nubinhibens]EAP75838.1 SlyX protein, putative [Roseovarius nubinhibens ISM]
MEHLEETIAHLTRQVDDLSDVVAHQQDQIDRLSLFVDKLMERERARAAEGTGGIVLGDERPPHY